MKRKFQVPKADSANTYVIIETVESGEIYVQFIPHVWLFAHKKNVAIKPRDTAKFYFPRRLPNQTKDKFMKFTKHAKFVCTVPENNDQWDCREGRVLKIGLASIEEAISAEKVFCEYFSTTEAEAAEIEPSKPKHLKRNKKAPVKTIQRKFESSSESEPECQQPVQTISNYNSCFVPDVPNNIIMQSVDADSFVSNMQGPEVFNFADLLTNDNENMINADTQSQQTANFVVLNDIGLHEPDKNYEPMERQILNFNAEANVPVGIQLATSNEL
ncbi:uncharacterized protein LOC119084768 [Bradysia coprophila]|uniref:uncharacterized protein LOC119084768 n=1 Tax=Bradysia coprophila TaxID=38358 RepID=UPI00187D76EA|nr:uncharacterized protein LOC119084768 [Bradysia coprophila]